MLNRIPAFCAITGGSKAARGNSNILASQSPHWPSISRLAGASVAGAVASLAKREAKQYDLHKGFDWSQAVC